MAQDDRPKPQTQIQIHTGPGTGKTQPFQLARVQRLVSSLSVEVGHWASAKAQGNLAPTIQSIHHACSDTGFERHMSEAPRSRSFSTPCLSWHLSPVTVCSKTLRLRLKAADAAIFPGFGAGALVTSRCQTVNSPNFPACHVPLSRGTRALP